MDRKPQAEKEQKGTGIEEVAEGEPFHIAGTQSATLGVPGDESGQITAV